MDKTRKYLTLKCEVCGDEYLQQERVYKKSKWKNRCEKHRHKIYTCRYCGVRVSAGYDKCKKCNGKLISKPPKVCKMCGARIHHQATICLSCHNKNQDKGKSRERTKFNASKKWNKIRAKCFERDGYKCRICEDSNYRGRGKTVVMNAHHIIPYKSHPELRLDPENIMTLCVDCHRKVHSLISWVKTDKKLWPSSAKEV